MNKLASLFNNKGYKVHKLSNIQYIKNAQRLIINSKHPKITKQSLFDRRTLKLQYKLFQNSIHLNIARYEEKFFKKILNVNTLDELSITSFFHLRAVKKSNKKNNFVGLHRETFYSDYKYTKHQINVSVPILNYNDNNSMKVISGSNKILDKKFKLKKLSSEESGVEKGSIKHKLGLPYNPKIIISGINPNKARRIKCQPGKIIVFSAMLIHGGGSNFSSKPRYSIDFALIKKKYIKNKKIKIHHISYSKSKKYWIDIPKLN
jgi:ectoine hydroxylase-related dioxygenase (phytanoyl-CoA dioxygenase family)